MLTRLMILSYLVVLSTVSLETYPPLYVSEHTRFSQREGDAAPSVVFWPCYCLYMQPIQTSFYAEIGQPVWITQTNE